MPAEGRRPGDQGFSDATTSFSVDSTITAGPGGLPKDFVVVRLEGYRVPESKSEEQICREILEAKAMEIRDVDGGQEPFLYSSGNWGPGYVMVKGTVGYQTVFKDLVAQLALRVVDSGIKFDFIAANATGGMVPGYQLREDLQMMTGREIPYTYVRGTRKAGGHKELVTGIENNPTIRPNSRALVIEELINFAQTTTNSAQGLRELGHTADNAATILHYHNPEAMRSLQDHGVEVVELTNLPTLLEIAEDYYPKAAVDSYRTFLKDPLAWQAQRGLEPVKS